MAISYQFYTPVSHHITCSHDYSDCGQYGVLMTYRENCCRYYCDHLSPIGTAAGDVGATCNLLGCLPASRTAGQIVARHCNREPWGSQAQDGSSIFLRNVGNTAAHLTKQLSCIHVFLNWNFVDLRISQFSHACYMSRPSHPWFYRPNYIQLLITWFSAASWHFLLQGCKCSR